MLSSTTGSVRPRSSPMIGLNMEGRNAGEGLEPRPEVARAGERRVPFDRAAAIHQRRVAQRLGAAGQHQIGHALLDVAVGGVDRLHARAAIDLHRECGHGLAHAEPQRRDARRVHLVGDHVDAAENDLVEGVRRKRLAQQQRPPALDGQIDRRERARVAARLEERRPAAVDDDRPAGPLLRGVRLDRSRVGDDTSPCAATARRGEISSGAKSSTAMTSATALRRPELIGLGLVDQASLRARPRRRAHAPSAAVAQRLHRDRSARRHGRAARRRRRRCRDRGRRSAGRASPRAPAGWRRRLA